MGEGDDRDDDRVVSASAEACDEQAVDLQCGDRDVAQVASEEKPVP